MDAASDSVGVFFLIAAQLFGLELTCFLQSWEVFAKAGKLLTKAEKFSAEFDVFRLKRFMLESALFS